MYKLFGEDRCGGMVVGDMSIGGGTKPWWERNSLLWWIIRVWWGIKDSDVI